MGEKRETRDVRRRRATRETRVLDREEYIFLSAFCHFRVIFDTIGLCVLGSLLLAEF